VGILAERLNRLEAGVTDGRLAGLTIRGRTVAGGRRSVEVVEIARPGAGGLPLMYGIKPAHGAEPDSAVLASDLAVGPVVLDVSDGRITEEYFPEATNLRQRRLGPDDYEPLGAACARLLMALVRPEADDLVSHKDEQPEHLFVLGEGRNLRVRLIDWGRADRWPMQRFEEWLARQLYWLAEAMPEPPGRQRLAAGYLALVEAQTAALDDQMRGRFAMAFLEFSARCGPLPMDLGWFNRFLAETGEARGKELAQAFEHAKR